MARKIKSLGADHWIPDLNRFGLAKPPDWWLRYMIRFDPDLYLMPSRKRAVYNFMRPARLSAGIGPMALTDKEGDLTAMKNLGMVPSAVLIPATNGSWTTNVFDEDLANRDIWRHGGADKFSEKLEQKEREKAQKDDVKLIDECLVRRRDMARSFKARTGQRTKLPVMKPKKNAVVLSGHPSPTVERKIVLATS